MKSTTLWMNNIIWWLNPARSPTWMGHVETFVKLIKKTLQILGPRTSYTEDHMINLRPLTSIETDSHTLTPADFLFTGSHDLSLAPRVVPEYSTLQTRKEILEDNVNASWKYFYLKYLRSLQALMQQYMPTDEIRMGDLVAIIDKNVNFMEYKYAIVVDTVPGKDKIARSFMLRDAGGKIFERNYQSLAKVLCLPPRKLSNSEMDMLSYGNNWN